MFLKKVLKKFFKTNKKKNKALLSVSQVNEEIIIAGEFLKQDYEAKELWALNRQTRQPFIMASTSPSNVFQFKCDFDKLKKLIQKESHEEETVTYDFFIRVKRPLQEADIDPVRKKPNPEAYITYNNDSIEYNIRLGRFQNTEINGLEPFSINDQYSIVYVTKKGNLSFNYGSHPDAPTRLQVDRIKQNFISGKIFTRNSIIKECKALLIGRQDNYNFKLPIEMKLLKNDVRSKYGLNRYIYKIDMQSLSHPEISKNGPEDIYDLYLDLQLHDQDEIKRVRVGRPAFKANFFNEFVYHANNEVNILNPYYTFKKKNLSFELYKFKPEVYEFMKKMLKYRVFYRVMTKNKPWIVGERIYKAQDTGYQFFKYMRAKHPDKNVFYVIEKGSPERKNLEGLGNVLEYKSKEHIKQVILASHVISSHHPDYLFPLRTPKFKKAVKASKVFLQHGVMGTKNMLANYGKKAPNFDTDLFLVSSDFEKNMIVQDFGYDKKDVKVTGLSRFDTLFENDVQVKRQIAIIPTWRDWITNNEGFLESDYFHKYKQLINDPDLHELKNRYNFEIVFCLHPNMQPYTHYFSDAPVKIISQGEVNVQDLLKESGLLITDYSSVAFDFSFLNKPVIYYQFDRSRFIGKRPSHLDLDNDLPGKIVYEEEQLLSSLKHYLKNDFEVETEYKIRANKFIKYRDENSSERIYEAIREYKREKTIYHEFAENKYIDLISKRFRKSSYYFPLMKKAYGLLRVLLPIDPELIVFESGIGKQFADSPRYIYEELNKSKNHYKIVWIYNGNLGLSRNNTKKVKRLSPAYYYYLARAGYWINNQNFPTYIKKSRKTTYIQTWHGTPLKKMLFDIDNIQGRDESYLARVHKATKNWDYLLSPSRYATEAFRSAFKYNNEVLELGYPRNDIFYRKDSDEMKRNIKTRLGLPDDKKVILYAPTFRDNKNKGKNKFIFDAPFDYEKIHQNLSEEYIVLMRMHVVISNKLNIPEEFKDVFYDVSKYPEIQELALIADLLVTDYSSIMFDFANTGKPILFYAYDLDEYRDDIRGFYMDFINEAPGPIVKTTDELIAGIQNTQDIQEQYNVKYQNFKGKYCYLDDGNASKRVVKHFFDKN